MQKPIITVIRTIATAIFISTIGLSAYSQKLNNVQEKGIWAPANIKIDARLNEWEDTFQADNKSIDVLYSIANDDKNLYLVIKSTNMMISNKIMAGGIDFTINPTGKKKDKDAFVMQYPVVNMANLRNAMQARMGRGGPGGPGGPGGGPRPMDSAAIAGMRKQAISMAKEIKLTGFKDIPDSIISIYNEYGVKAAVDYDRNGNLVCEMAIPLKYLFAPGQKDFAYNLKLNGLNISAMMAGRGNMPGGGTVTMMRVDGAGGPPAGAVTISDGGGGGFGGGGRGGFGGGGDFRPPPGMPSMSDMQNMISPTDFWAKYTMAKK